MKQMTDEQKSNLNIVVVVGLLVVTLVICFFYMRKIA